MKYTVLKNDLCKSGTSSIYYISIIYTMLCTSMCTNNHSNLFCGALQLGNNSVSGEKPINYCAIWCRIEVYKKMLARMYTVGTVVWSHTWLKISMIQGSLSPCANLQSLSLHSPRAKARHIASENCHRQVLHLDIK